MLKDERHYNILDYLSKHQFSNVKDLAKLLNISEITVRRDINELDKKGLLLKVHGGAQSLDSEIEKIDIDVVHRSSQNIDEKKKIAKLCEDLIRDDQSIYLDAGSNVHLVIPYLKNKNVKVYTHGIHHVGELIKYNIDTHLIGGDIKGSTLATIGSLSIEEVSRFNYDLAFLGSNALHLEFGYSTPEASEAALKQQIIKSSKESYILCDHTKFNKKSKIRFANTDQVTLITDQKPPKEYEQLNPIYPKETNES